MVQFLIRFFLSLYILLLGGYSQLSAHPSEGRDFYALIKNLKDAEQPNFDAEQDSTAFTLKAASSGTEKGSAKKTDVAEIVEVEEEEEEEDDESISFKKDLNGSHYYAAIFYDHLPEYFCHLIKNRLSFCKPFSYFPSFRSLYLIFRVFRI